MAKTTPENDAPVKDWRQSLGDFARETLTNAVDALTSRLDPYLQELQRLEQKAGQAAGDIDASYKRGQADASAEWEPRNVAEKQQVESDLALANGLLDGQKVAAQFAKQGKFSKYVDLSGDGWREFFLAGVQASIADPNRLLWRRPQVQQPDESAQEVEKPSGPRSFKDEAMGFAYQLGRAAHILERGGHPEFIARSNAAEPFNNAVEQARHKILSRAVDFKQRLGMMQDMESMRRVSGTVAEYLLSNRALDPQRRDVMTASFIEYGRPTRGRMRGRR